VEFKYAQGAKPGLGGHLLGDKNTPAVARMREAVLGQRCSHRSRSTASTASRTTRSTSTGSRKSTGAPGFGEGVHPTDVDMVAVGSYYAGAHIIHLDGSYGGTGAAPDIAKKNIAMPIEYAIGKVHKFLVAEGIRDSVTLIASGGIRTAYDVEGHRPGRGRRGHRHGRNGGAGLRALRLLRKRTRLSARHRQHRS
jgi:hypothetical protein